MTTQFGQCLQKSTRLVWLFKNRFHIAVMSKFGENKKLAHEAQPSVSLMFLPHFDVLCDPLLTDARQHGFYLFYIVTGKKAFLFQISPL